MTLRRSEQAQVCELGLTSQLLSTWRAGGLETASGEQARLISTHVQTCPACRAHLKAYDAIDVALRTQSVPQPDGDLWASTQERLASRHEREVPTARRRPGRVTWGAIAATAAAILLVAGFVQVLATHIPGRTSSGAAAITWHTVRLPAGSVVGYNHTVAVAPSDGHTAYVCAISPSAARVSTPSSASTLPSGTARVYRTRDAGTHWQQTAALPSLRHDINACLVTIDELNPATAVVVLAWSQVPAHQLSSSVTASYATFDSGLSWHVLTDPNLFAVAQLATARQTTYAILNSPYTSSLGPQLIASSDSWKTWRSIDHAMTASGQQVQSFWADPASGAILVEARDNDTSFLHLWLSNNGGVSWTALPSPPSNYFIARAGLPGTPWYVCGLRSETGAAAGPYALQCSSDGFRTWQHRPSLNRPTERDFTITADGALVAIGDATRQPSVYRLAYGSQDWERLAALPRSAPDHADILFSGDTRVATLWALPPLTADLAEVSSVVVAAYP
jgi:hypothetical protein